MDDPAANQTPGENFNKIDLSALEAFQFGTQWTSTGDSKKSGGDRSPAESRAPGDGPGRRDRRPPRRPSEQRPSHDEPRGDFSPGGGERDRRPARSDDRGGYGAREPGGGERGGFPRRGGPGREMRGGGGRYDSSEGRFDRGPRRPAGPPRPYESPVFEITFYPDDQAFTALVKAMRVSCRTYELFEIARLILGKPERCVVVIKRRAAPDVPGDAPRASLAISVPTGVPFEHEDEAVGYALEKNLDQFFTTETVEVEPPKGSFQFVNRCPLTKELLGPPNYHRYANIVQHHYTTRGIRMPFEKYKASIEVVRDPEAVNQWLESMKKITRYTFKGEVPAGETGVFDNLDEARAFLLRSARDRVVRLAESARVAAKVVEAATGTEAFRAMNGAVDVQRRFPLDTANALRGRLRRENFNIFKRGSKGVTYVCSVRRKFRQPGQSFSDSINRLIEFLDQNPMVAVTDLPAKFLGFTAPIVSAPAPKISAAPAAAASSEPSAATAGTETSTPAESAPAASAAESEPTTPPPSAAPEAPAITPEQRDALNRLMLDLRWLVSEGYVAEYSDGKLMAHPVMTPQAQAQHEKAEHAGEHPAAGEIHAPPTAENSDGESVATSEPSASDATDSAPTIESTPQAEEVGAEPAPAPAPTSDAPPAEDPANKPIS